MSLIFVFIFIRQSIKHEKMTREQIKNEIHRILKEECQGTIRGKTAASIVDLLKIQAPGISLGNLHDPSRDLEQENIISIEENDQGEEVYYLVQFFVKHVQTGLLFTVDLEHTNWTVDRNKAVYFESEEAVTNYIATGMSGAQNLQANEFAIVSVLEGII